MQNQEKIWMFILGTVVALLTAMDKYSNSELFSQKQDTFLKKILKIVSLGGVGGFVGLVTGILYIKFIDGDKEMAYIAAGSAAIFARDIFYLIGNSIKNLLINRINKKGF